METKKFGFTEWAYMAIICFGQLTVFFQERPLLRGLYSVTVLLWVIALVLKLRGK